MRVRVQRMREAGQGSSLSIRAGCEALGVARSRLYYKARPLDVDSEVTLQNEIREIYAKRPFQGYKRITDDLKDLGYEVNHKRVYRLMRQVGLQALYPKKNLSKRRQEDKVYPYLLREQRPRAPHDAWCVDISYIKTTKGFIYLTALIDVVSRCVMGYSVSPFLDTDSCLDALEMALKTGYKPRIINSDQGCQFTAQAWIYSLRLVGAQISMDGKGRWADNIAIERFWRTLKYEEVYLKTYDTVGQARAELGAYIQWYNHHRRHTSLGKARPWEVMRRGLEGCGLVENPAGLHTGPTAPTSTKKLLFLYKKENIRP